MKVIKFKLNGKIFTLNKKDNKYYAEDGNWAYYVEIRIMKTFKFEAWYRQNDEKDFFQGEIEALDWESAESKIKETDRRIFTVEKQ